MGKYKLTYRFGQKLHDKRKGGEPKLVGEI
jgi:hypothetical protein